MLNRYQLAVLAKCPVDKSIVDSYQFTIESPHLIEVERITAFFRKHTARPIFQEQLTKLCALAFGAQVTSEGWHSGVKVTSSAP